MTNKELVSDIAEQLGWTQVKVSEVLAQTVELLSSKLANNDVVTIANLGVFQTKKRDERISVNPLTEQRFLVPPKISVNFKPTSGLKEKYK